MGITGNYFIDKLAPLAGVTILPRYRKNTHNVNESNYLNHFIALYHEKFSPPKYATIIVTIIERIKVIKADAGANIIKNATAKMHRK